MDVRLLNPGKAEVGKEVAVLYEGKEYKCKVVEVKPNEVKVEVRWSAELITSIWVRRDTMDVRLLNPGEAEVGKMVTVLYEDKEYKCKVVEVKQGKWGRAVKVHYVGYNAGHDQWVPTIRVRRDIFKERAEEDQEVIQLDVDVEHKVTMLSLFLMIGFDHDLSGCC